MPLSPLAFALIESIRLEEKASKEGKELVPFAIESAVGLSALTVRVAGAAVDGLFHVTAVGVIFIVQIAVSGGGGSGNVSESVVTECAVGCRGREVGKYPQVRRLQVESEGGG